MSKANRRARIDAGHRSRHGRTLVALIAATALTLGPGALSALADEAAPPPVAAEQVAAPPPAETVPEVVAPPADPGVATETDPAAETPATTESTDDAEAAAAATESQPQAAARVAPELAKTDGDNNPHNKIKICHATGAEKNPWVINRPNANGTVDGHAGMSHQYRQDIIPPFDYNEDGQTLHFPGQQWDEAGQAIYNNYCNTPVPEPMDPVISVSPPVCVPVGQPVPATIAVSLEDLMVGFNYSVEISRTGWSDSVDFVAESTTAMIDAPVNGFGAYTATVYGPEQLSDSTSSSFIQREGPDPRGNVTFCHAVTDYPEVAKVASFADFLYYEILTLPKGEVLANHVGVDPEDIIPPFSYFDGESPAEFLGQNWDEYGQQLLRNNCEQTIPVPVLSITISQCHGTNGVVPSNVLVTIGSLWVGTDYTLTVTGPGDYTAELSSPDEAPVPGAVAFTVNPTCAVVTPPVVTKVASPTRPVLVDAGIGAQGTPAARLCPGRNLGRDTSVPGSPPPRPPPLSPPPIS